MEFSELVKAEMDKRGWSQAELARRSKQSRAYIHSILIGESNNPKLDKAYMIAQAFDMTLQEMAERLYS